MDTILGSTGGNAGNAPLPDGSADDLIGDAGEVSREPTANDNGPEWTSFAGNGASGSGYSDPDTATANGGSGDGGAAPYGRFANGKPRKRPARGSKPGGGGTGKRNPAQEAIPLASLLFSTHFMASKFLIPELELSEDESKVMARALTEVGQYYEIPMVSPQQVAWYNLASTAAMIYGSRFVAYRNRSRKEAAEKRAGNVSQMRPANLGVMQG